MSSLALDVLEKRGFLQQCTNRELLGRLLESEKLTFYCGFDPTGPSLHAGHLIPLFAMAHLNRAGHKAIALVGGGTALIGDPSGRDEMRNIQTRDQISENAESIKVQIARFIDFDSGSAVLLDNAEWLTELNYIEFLRTIGRHFSVNRMLSFEAYKSRLEAGLSFIEFNYQLLQSYDFLILYQRHGCLLQIGGDDQWGNIVAGADLIRRMENTEAIGLTFPLVARSDGKKMGKTEKGALYLDPEKTSPYDFYQYWRNIADPDVGKFLRLYTFLSIDEISRLEGLKDRDINKAKEVLAFELTKIVHGQERAKEAQTAARAMFEGAEGEVSLPSVEINSAELKSGIPVLELFARTELCSSRGEARRLITQGGASINEKRIEDIGLNIDEGWIVDGKLLLRAGKKRYFQVIVK